jgi:hypothetical protein
MSGECPDCRSVQCVCSDKPTPVSLCGHGKTLTECHDKDCHVRLRQIAVIPASDGNHDRTLYGLDQHGRVFVYEGSCWTQMNDDQVRRVTAPPPRSRKS